MATLKVEEAVVILAALIGAGIGWVLTGSIIIAVIGIILGTATGIGVISLSDSATEERGWVILAALMFIGIGWFIYNWIGAVGGLVVGIIVGYVAYALTHG